MNGKYENLFKIWDLLIIVKQIKLKECVGPANLFKANSRNMILEISRPTFLFNLCALVDSKFSSQQIPSPASVFITNNLVSYKFELKNSKCCFCIWVNINRKKFLYKKKRIQRFYIWL